MKISLSKLLIAINCFIILFFGSIINRMNIQTEIYLSIIMITNLLYSLKSKELRHSYFFLFIYIVQIIIWIVAQYPVHTRIFYIVLLIEELHFFNAMFHINKDNVKFARKIIILYMVILAIYGIFEGIVKHNPVFLRFCSASAVINYKNSFLFTYNTIGSMEESLIFSMLLAVSSIFLLNIENKRISKILYIIFGIAIFFTNKRSSLLVWLLMYGIYTLYVSWYIKNTRDFVIKVLKILGIFILGSIVLSFIRYGDNNLLYTIVNKFSNLFSNNSRSYLHRSGSTLMALKIIFYKNSLLGFLFGNGLSSLIQVFVDNNIVITDYNFFVIDNQYITSWYDNGIIFVLLCIYYSLHYYRKMIKLIKDNKYSDLQRENFIIIAIGILLLMSYAFIVDIFSWIQPIFIASFIFATSNYYIGKDEKNS